MLVHNVKLSNVKYVCSKKDAVLRQSELRSHISPALVKFVSENCRSLVEDVDTQCLVMSTIKYSSRMLTLFFV